MRPWQRSADFRFVLLCVGVSAASLWFALRYFHRTFPEASIDFEVTRVSSRPVAERFLAAQGISTARYRHAARFQYDEDAKVFLERELGLDRLNAGAARDVRLWRWGHRWSRPRDAEEVRAEVTPRGEIAGFTHVLPEEAPGPDLEPEVARSIAESFMVLDLARRIETLEFVDAETRKRPKRTDHLFTWRVAGRDYRGASHRASVTVAGDRVVGYQEWLEIPEEWSRGYARLRSLNDATALVDSLLVGLLALALATTLGRRLRRRDIRWRPALSFGGIALVLELLASLNAFPLAEFGFDTAGSYPAFLARTIVGALLSAFGAGVLVFLLTAAAEPVYRETFPRHLAISRLFTWAGVRTRSFFMGSLAGITLACVLAAYAIGFYLVATSSARGRRPRCRTPTSSARACPGSSCCWAGSSRRCRRSSSFAPTPSRSWAASSAHAGRR